MACPRASSPGCADGRYLIAPASRALDLELVVGEVPALRLPPRPARARGGRARSRRRRARDLVRDRPLTAADDGTLRAPDRLARLRRALRARGRGRPRRQLRCGSDRRPRGDTRECRVRAPSPRERNRGARGRAHVLAAGAARCLARAALVRARGPSGFDSRRASHPASRARPCACGSRTQPRITGCA